MNRRALLGAIADDFTGATDLASILTSGGMRTVATIGVPPADLALPDADALVVALKSRTAPVAESLADSLGAFEWLSARGCRQFFFKYCSTFDSTDAGNIGPVADALLDALGEEFTIACPAFPENGRTVFRGHLFVGGALLSDSPMRDHPLTPMRDSNLVRVLGRQTRHRVGLAAYEAVAKGSGALRARFAELRRDGFRHAIVDAVEDGHLATIGVACRDLRLVTGGSGVALGLPANFRAARLLAPGGAALALPELGGRAAVLAGSCSAATLDQVAEMKRNKPAFRLDPMRLAADGAALDEVVAWARENLAHGPLLVYSSAPPAEVAAAQERVGRERAAGVVEQALACLATELVREGVDKLVVAGGETSGAVVRALGVRALAIGPQIDPGVPWTLAVPGRPLALALKSGNFGARDFFRKAFALLR